MPPLVSRWLRPWVWKRLNESGEEDKARLVQETGLQLKQINNWFINQRKRNWHSNPSSSTTTKSKRKSSNAGESRNDRFA
ncbi:hypothetical protein RHMOL_Rhmol01G0042000 [Rhododendron molle]|uniref:Uncharacterized protein n=1 Tax=Rhododendron molle TaxID=49168 RepID=A0ACC0Q0W8_RHOML|nr:hypothetical protein RHMOL_Rhmol01G0042000 [Rhododendron molle]